jgi:hypothetical protein
MKDKLCQVGEKLKSWGQRTFGAVRRELQTQKKRLEQLRSHPTRVNISDEERKLVEHISLLNYREDIMWKQHSRIAWLREGDSNTSFFHQRASRRMARNRIVRLNRPDGSECTNVEETQAMTVDFYSNLFKSKGTSNMHIVLDYVPHKVTHEMNEFLCAPFDENEVKQALFQMFPTKAPSLMVF